MTRSTHPGSPSSAPPWPPCPPSAAGGLPPAHALGRASPRVQRCGGCVRSLHACRCLLLTTLRHYQTKGPTVHHQSQWKLSSATAQTVSHICIGCLLLFFLLSDHLAGRINKLTTRRLTPTPHTYRQSPRPPPYISPPIISLMDMRHPYTLTLYLRAVLIPRQSGHDRPPNVYLVLVRSLLYSRRNSTYRNVSCACTHVSRVYRVAVDTGYTLSRYNIIQP